MSSSRVIFRSARHEIAGLGYALQRARALAADAPMPYYLAVGGRVRRRVARGAPLRCADVELPGVSVLLRLRQAQDARLA